MVKNVGVGQNDRDRRIKHAGPTKRGLLDTPPRTDPPY